MFLELGSVSERLQQSVDIIDMSFAPYCVSLPLENGMLKTPLKMVVGPG